MNSRPTRSSASLYKPCKENEARRTALKTDGAMVCTLFEPLTRAACSGVGLLRLMAQLTRKTRRGGRGVQRAVYKSKDLAAQ
eukprot:6156939-Pleurochrysis_carterae.AAC.1